MKKLLKVVLIAGCIVFAGTIAQAQTKTGYINFNAVIDQMPDTKVISAQLQTYQQTFITQLQSMQTEYQTKGADYEAKRATMTDAVRTQKEAELTDLQKRIQDYQTTAQGKVEAEKDRLGKPLLDKVKLAITTVAKEKGYGYVIDSSQGIFIVSPEADDLMPAVKIKLGLK
jgi:outer membrane protein